MLLAVPEPRAGLFPAAACTGRDLRPELIMSDLRSRLPERTMPRRIAVLDELPPNTNGKIDRQAAAAAIADRRDQPPIGAPGCRRPKGAS
ncbi:hypothetical protein ACFC6U_24485 [Kitasatospora purpeofusca]|uniref:hypothetical protein n=1 Tax=Kitasatospora purpeofusca TaxID=67352 RepID=UPI0035E040F8